MFHRHKAIHRLCCANSKRTWLSPEKAIQNSYVKNPKSEKKVVYLCQTVHPFPCSLMFCCWSVLPCESSQCQHFQRLPPSHGASQSACGFRERFENGRLCCTTCRSHLQNLSPLNPATHWQCQYYSGILAQYAFIFLRHTNYYIIYNTNNYSLFLSTWHWSAK